MKNALRAFGEGTRAKIGGLIIRGTPLFESINTMCWSPSNASIFGQVVSF